MAKITVSVATPNDIYSLEVHTSSQLQRYLDGEHHRLRCCAREYLHARHIDSRCRLRSISLAKIVVSLAMPDDIRLQAVQAASNLRQYLHGKHCHPGGCAREY